MFLVRFFKQRILASI
jgi:palmitoyltransferase ZDHHC13/17